MADLPPLIPGLPDDISLLCLARLPLSSHLLLSRVSRSWRFTLRSPLLFALRSHLRSVEPLLLLNLRTPSAHSLWFFLDVSTRRIRLLPLPPPPLPAVGSSCAVLGPHLYLLGGLLNGAPSSTVQIFDARVRQWALGPDMSVPREFAAAAALGGRIYAVGGCSPDSDAWAESLDPAHREWAPVPSPAQLRKERIRASAVLGGKLLAVADGGGVAFDPTADAAWGPVPEALDRGWWGRGAVVGGALYAHDLFGKIRGYDPAADEWREVDGVETNLPKFFHGATMAGLGGLLCLVWEGMGNRESKEVDVCCAGVKVSKVGDGRLTGEIVWVDSMRLALPKATMILRCLTVEL